MLFMDYKRRRGLTVTEKYILDTLIDDNKNIYQLFTEIKKRTMGGKKGRKSTPYPTIQRTILRLEKEGFIRLAEVGMRKSKFFEITPYGISVTYFANRGKRDPLQFHRSNDGRRIIDKYVKVIFKYEKIDDDEIQNSFILKAFYNSPSFMEIAPFLPNLNEPTIIRDSSIIDRISKDTSLTYIHFQRMDEKNLHLSYLSHSFPMIFLARDFLAYPDDQIIKTLLINTLVDRNKATGKHLKELGAKTSNHVIQDIKAGKKEMFIYVPPLGEPILACGEIKCMKENLKMN
jgi:DNA-binding PadR family transcriptional regulator